VSYVRGVINLRGVVLTIVDLAARLGFPAVEPTSSHVIMVAQVGDQPVGLLVDAVSDILSVSADQIQPTPNVGSELASVFVRGVVAHEGRMISMIALDEILSADVARAA
jgi:purine-binding chemotaxis protein CheW